MQTFANSFSVALRNIAGHKTKRHCYLTMKRVRTLAPLKESLRVRLVLLGDACSRHSLFESASLLLNHSSQSCHLSRNHCVGLREDPFRS